MLWLDRRTSIQPMSRQQMTVLYSGRVQGVGFRYTVKSLTPGFEVTGTVRNLTDGRVELQAEGERAELDAFRQAVRESGLGGLIKQEEESFAPATGQFRGFEIVR
jgi:acylphosphatase